MKEKKKIIEELSKLKIQDRTVIGKDGVTKFYPVIRSPYILPIVFWTKFKIFLTAGTTLTVAGDLLLSLNLGPGKHLAPWPKITQGWGKFLAKIRDTLFTRIQYKMKILKTQE